MCVLQVCKMHCVCQDSRNNTYTCLRYRSNSIDYKYCEFEDDDVSTDDSPTEVTMETKVKGLITDICFLLTVTLYRLCSPYCFIVFFWFCLNFVLLPTKLNFPIWRIHSFLHKHFCSATSFILFVKSEAKL